MIAIQYRVHVALFSSLNEGEKMRFVIAVPFQNQNDRTEFYQQIGLKTIEEYHQMSIDAEPFQKLHFLLLAGDVQAVHFFLEFVKMNLAASFVEVREMTELIELADLKSLDSQLITPIVCVSLYFAAYNAVWKGYINIIGMVRNRILTLRGLLVKEHWLDSFLKEAILVIDMFASAVNESHIYTVGRQFLNIGRFGKPLPSGQKYGRLYRLDDGHSWFSMESALMWFDLTPYSPVTLNNRHYVF
jgi:hypothetical protein